jgi:hypothetical protein
MRIRSQRAPVARAIELRSLPLRLLAVPIVFALVITVFTVQAQPVSTPGVTSRFFAPYVDMSLTAAQDLVSIQKRTGLRAVTLAFLSSPGSGCAVGWGGLKQTLPSDKLPNGATIQETVKELERSGVQVILSFGGQGATEPASTCKTSRQLAALYQSVIDRYGVTMLDFDIEGKAAADLASIDLRNQALAALKRSHPALNIAYTLEAMPTGLTGTGLNILSSAAKAGLTVDVVNLMAMDYGSGVDHRATMGAYAIQAAESAKKQIQATGLNAAVGITVMIGVNDEQPEVFTMSDTQAVLDFAHKNSYVQRLGVWSLERDNGHCPGRRSASPECSGIQQRDFEFTTEFMSF